MKGIVTKTTGKWYNVEVNNIIYNCILKGKFKIENKLTNPITSGDYVDIKINEGNNATIEYIYKRNNYIIRKSNRNNKGHIIASNIDQVLILCSLKEPYTKISFIDRCLISTKYYDIEPIIVFNKIDILDYDEEKNLNIIVKKYLDIGFKILIISAKKKIYNKNLFEKLNNKKTVIIGNSGVGKSTLINLFSKKSKQKTNLVSHKTKKGKQTTTFSEIFKINKNSYLFDTPGFKEFKFFEIEKNDIKYTYPEFNKYSDKCKFNNCNHTNEPECAIKNNIEKIIWKKRYNNYLSIINSL